LETAVKLSKLIDSILTEAERSQAAQEAEKLGLVYMGYGRYKDPKTNKVVAKSINGTLVKIEDDGSHGPATNSRDPNLDDGPGDYPGSDGPSSDEYPDDVPDSYTNTVAEPETPEPEIPAHATGLERLLAAAGGDALKVRKALVKQFHAGKTSAKGVLAQLDKYEAAQKANLQASVAAVQKRKEDELAAKKAKYASLYPSPQI
jgi:hypothetical protein